MDEYGCFRHTKEDAIEIANKLLDTGAVVFSYSHDQVGAMIVLICRHFNKLGVLPFGGNPKDRFYVGIYGTGMGHLSSEVGPHHNYLEDKLNLKGEDAKKFAEFYSWIIEEYRA